MNNTLWQNALKKTVLLLLLACMPIISQAKTIEIDVNGLVCAFCAQGIDKTLRKFPATADVFVSLEHRLVAVQLKPDQDLADADLRKAIVAAGYTVVAIRRVDTPLDDIRNRIKQK